MRATTVLGPAPLGGGVPRHVLRLLERDRLKVLARQGLHLAVIRAHNDEARGRGAEEVDGFEDVHHLFRAAAVQIVQEDHEALRQQGEGLRDGDNAPLRMSPF